MATRRTATAADPRAGRRRPPGLTLHASVSPRERSAAVDAFRATLTERLEAEHATLVRQTELRAAADAPMRALLASLVVRQQASPAVKTQNHDDLLVLKGLIEAGKVTPVIDRTYPLTEAAAAIGHLAAGHARGTVVLTI